MNKVISLIIVGVLVLSGLGAVAIQGDMDKNETVTVLNTEYVITVSEPTFTEKNDYLSVDLDESESFLMETGRPMLPVITKVFTFPLGTKIVDVNVDYNVEKQMLPGKIQPSPAPVPLTDDLSYGKISTESVIDKNVYSSSSLYPVEPYAIKKGAGLDHGENVLFLNIKVTPQYSPSDNILYMPYGKINIDVRYMLPETPFFTCSDTYDLLIITSSKFSTLLQPLIEHKNSIGVKTILKTTEDIYSEYTDGRDNQEKIKLCIYDMKNTYNISYVLLAGGRQGQTNRWYVPERVTNNAESFESGTASDLYYADVYKIVGNDTVFEDWDSNGNGIFAEWSDFANKKDVIDYHPDVAIGRIPFRYSFEVGPVVNKIIKYENTANDSWFKKAVVVAGDTFPPARGGSPGWNEGEIETVVTVNLLEGIGFNVSKLWASLGTFTGQAGVISNITAGCGFVQFAGHGNPSSWATFPVDAENNSDIIDGLLLTDMSKLNNGYKLPVIIVGGCHNGQFNTTMSNIIKDIIKYNISGYFFEKPFRFFYMEWVPTCFCSWLVKQRGGGAIGSAGNSGLGYGYVNEHATEGLGGWIEPRFFHAYTNQGMDTLGGAHAQSLTDYVNIIDNVNSDRVDRKTVEEWVLFGDPSLKLGGV